VQLESEELSFISTWCMAGNRIMHNIVQHNRTNHCDDDDRNLACNECTSFSVTFVSIAPLKTSVVLTFCR
jgi:hypothetical protein